MPQLVAFCVPLTGTGTSVLTLHPKVGHKVVFFIGTLELPWCCLFYQWSAAASLPSSVRGWSGETREVLWLFVLV